MNTSRLRPIIHAQYRIQKIERTGGWHFVELEGIPLQFVAANGLVRVSGRIDEVEVKQINLLPMKNGNKLLVIKAAIRKQIGKKAGDHVTIKLYPDDSAIEVPEEILDSLLQSPGAYANFEKMTDSNKKYYIDWITEARSIDTKTTRILKMIRQLEQNRKFWDWPAPDSKTY